MSRDSFHVPFKSSLGVNNILVIIPIGSLKYAIYKVNVESVEEENFNSFFSFCAFWFHQLGACKLD